MMIKKISIAFLMLCLAFAFGSLAGINPLCGQAYAGDTMPDSGDDPDGNDSGNTGNGGPDDTYDGGGYDDGGFADPDGSGSYDGI